MKEEITFLSKTRFSSGRQPQQNAFHESTMLKPTLERTSRKCSEQKEKE